MAGYTLSSTVVATEAAAASGLTTVDLAEHGLLPDLDGRYDREQCERVGLQRHRRGDPPGYWLTITQLAELLGVSRQAVYKQGRPVRLTRSGLSMVRRADVDVRQELANKVRG